MMEPLRIFIGWDPREAEAASVLKWSLQAQATCPLSIEFLRLEDLANHPLLGSDYVQKLANRGGATAFSFSRFLVPYLCKFRGWALFLDCDMLAVGDVAEIADLRQVHSGPAVFCTQHEWQPTSSTKMDGQPQHGYPRKLWSSCMLIDCGHTGVMQLQPRAVLEDSGAFLHRFQWLDDSELGQIPLGWNQVEGPITDDTRLLHWTEFPPWFDESRDRDPWPGVWSHARDSYGAACEAVLDMRRGITG